MAELSKWTSNRKADPEEPETSETPVEDEEAPPSEYDRLIELVRMYLPEIEENAANIPEEELTTFQSELSQEAADSIVELLDGFDESFAQMAAGIDEDGVTQVTTAVMDDLEYIEPVVFAAWLYRAGQLV